MDLSSFSVGWICALPLELAAGQAMLDELYDRQLTSNLIHHDEKYTLGRIADHNITMTCLPVGRKGGFSATVAAVRMKSRFPSLQMCLLVGIGGGVPSKKHDIRLGDVVVSVPEGDSGGVWQYDFGKLLADGSFQHVGRLPPVPAALLSSLSGLIARHENYGSAVPTIIQDSHGRFPHRRGHCDFPGAEADVLFQYDYTHQGEEYDCKRCDRAWIVQRSIRTSSDPVIHYGTIASGNLVMRSGAERERIRRKHDVLCFEMEAAGVFEELPCLVIRGICDYADSHKNKRWQPYAATTAAAYAKELLLTIHGRTPSRPQGLSAMSGSLSTVDTLLEADLNPFRRSNQNIVLPPNVVNNDLRIDQNSGRIIINNNHYYYTDTVRASRNPSPFLGGPDDKDLEGTRIVSPALQSGHAPILHRCSPSIPNTDRISFEKNSYRESTPDSPWQNSISRPRMPAYFHENQTGTSRPTSPHQSFEFPRQADEDLMIWQLLNYHDLINHGNRSDDELQGRYWRLLTKKALDLYEQIWDRIPKDQDGLVRREDFQSHIEPSDRPQLTKAHQVWNRIVTTWNREFDNTYSTVLLPRNLVLAALHMIHLEIWRSDLRPRSNVNPQLEISKDRFKYLTLFGDWVDCECRSFGLGDCGRKWNFQRDEGFAKGGSASVCGVEAWLLRGRQQEPGIPPRIRLDSGRFKRLWRKSNKATCDTSDPINLPLEAQVDKKNKENYFNMSRVMSQMPKPILQSLLDTYR